MNDNEFNKLVSISYKRPSKVPVKFSYNSETSTLTITANVSFSKSLLKTYENRRDKKSKLSSKAVNSEEMTFADVGTLGIIRKWSGTYDMSPWGGPSDMKVVVNINRKDKNEVPEKEKYFRIQRVYGEGTSFVTSPFWRWFWGVFRGNKECFVTLNWSPLFPGTINMNKYHSKNAFQSTIAHEFGHILGLGDAYDAFYRFFYNAPDSETYMMRYNRKVNPLEIMMALRAHDSGKMQYFPCEFNWDLVVSSIKKALFNNH